MAVVVPNGVLFRGSTEGSIRQKLVEENLLDAVIGLPDKLFFGTGIPAAILMFRKRKADDSVIFIDASRDYEAGTNQNRLGTAQVDRIVAAYLARETVDKYAFRARLSDIRDNDFNLNLPRYVDTYEEEGQIDLMSVRVERLRLKAEMEGLEARMAGYLAELGYGS
jgi:type I restriction enzyme M protein